MSVCYRSLVLGVGAVAIAFGVTILQPPARANRATESGCGVWWLEPTEDLELNSRFAGIQHRIASKSRLVEDLIAGTRTLRDVAYQFDALDRTTSHYLSLYRDKYPDAAPNERAARVVMKYLTMNELSRAERIRVMMRLVAEYRTWFGHEYPGSFDETGMAIRESSGKTPGDTPP